MEKERRVEDFLDLVTKERKTPHHHLRKSEWCHSVSWGPRLREKEEVS